MSRREFQLSEGTSNKFWAIELDGKSHTVHFGRIGTSGQTQTKEFASVADAQKAHDKLIADLTTALEPGSRAAVLAVFQLLGWQDYRRVFGECASDELIVEMDGGAEASDRLVDDLSAAGVTARVLTPGRVVVSVDRPAVFDLVRDTLADSRLGVRRLQIEQGQDKQDGCTTKSAREGDQSHFTTNYSFDVCSNRQRRVGKGA